MTNSEKIKILFFGELPPNVVHGVSISNKINTDILSEIAEVFIVQEQWSLRDQDLMSIQKFLRNISSVIKVLKKSILESPHVFYAIFSVSVFGGMKNVFNCLLLRVTNPKIKLLLHVHRSDLKQSLDDSILINSYIKILNLLGVTFILLSELQKSECKHYLKSSVVLYNCIDENEVYPIENVDSNQFQNKPKVKFLYLSNYVRKKGILDLLEAFNSLNSKVREEISLACYGAFSDSETQEKILNLSSGIDEITIHSTVYGSEKNSVLNDADVIVLPSYNEGLPLILLESMTLSKPIIVSKIGYIPEILGENYPLYCKVGDVSSIKKAMLRSIKLNGDDDFRSDLYTKYQKINFAEHHKKLTQIISNIIRPLELTIDRSTHVQ